MGVNGREGLEPRQKKKDNERTTTMNTIKFEIGKTYNDRSAYGDAFSSWKCVGRTASTVTFKCVNSSGVNKFRVTVIGGEEVVRRYHIYAKNVAS